MIRRRVFRPSVGAARGDASARTAAPDPHKGPSDRRADRAVERRRANQILARLFSISAFALDGFAFAAETLVGQAIGAKRPGDLQRAINLAFQWGLIGAGVLTVGLLLGGPSNLALMTTAPDVRAVAARLPLRLIAAPLVGFAAWFWDGIFIGALLTGATLRAVLPSVALYAVGRALLVPTFGRHGLWAALTLMNMARGFTLWQRRGQVLALAA